MKKFMVFLVFVLLGAAGYYGYMNYWPSDEIAVMNREDDQMLIMEEDRDCRLIAEVIVEEAVIRQEPSVKAPLFQVTLVPGDKMIVYETHEKWLKIRTENDIIGFIHKKDVKRYEECQPE